MIERVNKLSTRLLEVILAEFPHEYPEVIITGIIDVGIKASKVLHLTGDNVDACDLILNTVASIRKAEHAQESTSIKSIS